MSEAERLRAEMQRILSGEETMKSGAIDDDWHERNDSGYIPGGAAALAEKILAEPDVLPDAAPRWLKAGESRGQGRTGLRAGYGDPRLL